MLFFVVIVKGPFINVVSHSVTRLFKKTINLYIYNNVILRELNGRGHFETVLISHWGKNLCIMI